MGIFPVAKKVLRHLLFVRILFDHKRLLSAFQPLPFDIPLANGHILETNLTKRNGFNLFPVLSCENEFRRDKKALKKLL